jgi:hypothetical protein
MDRVPDPGITPNVADAIQLKENYDRLTAV